MSDIREISSEELMHDYGERLQDLMVCMVAISVGVMEYGDGECVHCRIEGNIKILGTIRQELMRREDPIGAALEKVEPKYG